VVRRGRTDPDGRSACRCPGAGGAGRWHGTLSVPVWTEDEDDVHGWAAVYCAVG